MSISNGCPDSRKRATDCHIDSSSSQVKREKLDKENVEENYSGRESTSIKEEVSTEPIENHLIPWDKIKKEKIDEEEQEISITNNSEQKPQIKQEQSTESAATTSNIKIKKEKIEEILTTDNSDQKPQIKQEKSTEFDASTINIKIKEEKIDEDDDDDDNDDDDDDDDYDDNEEQEISISNNIDQKPQIKQESSTELTTCNTMIKEEKIDEEQEIRISNNIDQKPQIKQEPSTEPSTCNIRTKEEKIDEEQVISISYNIDQKPQIKQEPSIDPATATCNIKVEGALSQTSVKKELKGEVCRYSCSYCPSVMDSYRKVKQHLRKQHKGELLKIRAETGILPPKKINPNKGAVFRCKLCTLEFDRLARLIEHQKKHTGKDPYSCADCEQTFPCFKTCYVHRMKFHANLPKYECVICKIPFKRLTKLYAHEVTHADEKKPIDIIESTINSSTN